MELCADMFVAVTEPGCRQSTRSRVHGARFTRRGYQCVVVHTALFFPFVAVLFLTVLLTNSSFFISFFYIVMADGSIIFMFGNPFLFAL